MIFKLLPSANRTDDNASALDALAWRARKTPDSMLLALESIGLFAALAILLWLPARIGLSLPFIALGMFGLWGITEHARRKSLRRSIRTALSVFQFVLASVGILAIIALMFRAGGLAIGTFIS